MTYSLIGRKRQVCEVCGARLSTNAWARSGHERGLRHAAALERANECHARLIDDKDGGRFVGRTLCGDPSPKTTTDDLVTCPDCLGMLADRAHFKGGDS